MAEPDDTSSPRPDTPAGFEELAMPLFFSLYNFARWLTRSPDEAEDLVQETYVKALRGFASFQQGTSFKSWIFRILKNTFLTSRAGLRLTVPLAPDEDGDAIASTAETPEAILIARASREKVGAAIEGLPPAFREVVLLRDVEGLTYQEIAEALSIPIGTVMSRLSRGRRSIREAIREAERNT